MNPAITFNSQVRFVHLTEPALDRLYKVTVLKSDLPKGSAPYKGGAVFITLASSTKPNVAVEPGYINSENLSRFLVGDFTNPPFKIHPNRMRLRLGEFLTNAKAEIVAQPYYDVGEELTLGLKLISVKFRNPDHIMEKIFYARPI